MTRSNTRRLFDLLERSWRPIVVEATEVEDPKVVSTVTYPYEVVKCGFIHLSTDSTPFVDVAICDGDEEVFCVGINNSTPFVVLCPPGFMEFSTNLTIDVLGPGNPTVRINTLIHV